MRRELTVLERNLQCHRRPVPGVLRGVALLTHVCCVGRDDQAVRTAFYYHLLV